MIYYQIIKGNELKENISENDIAAVHDRLFDRVGWLIDKYEWDSTVDRISQIYANKEVQIKNYDVQQYLCSLPQERNCWKQFAPCKVSNLRYSCRLWQT